MVKILRKDAYTIAEVAQIKRTTRSAVHRAIVEGRLKAERFGRQWLVRIEDVGGWNPIGREVYER